MLATGLTIGVSWASCRWFESPLLAIQDRFTVMKRGSQRCDDDSPHSNVNDGVASERTLEADRWHHVALTAVPENGQRRMRLFIDGEQVAEGLTTKWSE